MAADVPSSRFQTTLWSVVARAGGPDGSPKHSALDALCGMYWRPLFVYCLGLGNKVEDAEDMTQGFFAHLLARDVLRVADPERGRFRTFLLASFKNFMAGEWHRQRAAKRGGGVVHLSFDVDFSDAGRLVPPGDIPPDRAYDRQWAIDLVARATAALRAEMAGNGRIEWFEWVAGSRAGAPYAAVAAELGSTEDAVKSFAMRTRRRFRDLMRREIADTTGSPEDAAGELAYIVELLRG